MQSIGQVKIKEKNNQSINHQSINQSIVISIIERAGAGAERARWTRGSGGMERMGRTGAGTTSEASGEAGGIGRVEEKRKPEERKLAVERKAKGEERAREVEGEGQRTTGGI